MALTILAGFVAAASMSHAVFATPTLLITSADGPEGLVLTRAALALLSSTQPLHIIAGVENMTSEGAATLHNAGVQLRPVDSARPVAASVFKDVESVLILPPLTDDRVDRTRRIVNAAARAHVSQGMLLSVMGPDFGSLASYRLCEQYVRDNWPERHVLLRTAFYMQNLLLWAPDVVARSTLRLQLQPEERIAPLYEDDVAVVALAVALAPDLPTMRGVLNLTGPEALSGPQVAKRLSNSLGHHIRYERATREQLISMLALTAPSLTDSEQRLVVDLANVKVVSASGTIERLAHRSATSIDVFFEQSKEAFRPSGSRAPSLLI